MAVEIIRKLYDFIFYVFVLCFQCIYLWFCYNYLYYSYYILPYASIVVILVQRVYYYSTMNTFEWEYPFGDFLEDSKFCELSEYLQLYCQNNNAVSTMTKRNIPMNDLIIHCEWETNILHNIYCCIFTYLLPTGFKVF